ncbi:MAG: DNA methyltransferase [Methylophilus sp.]|uniref:DNA methyltransferase n=1 Tax=Methylophilus sp. TaxID=29541 RepID=UPI003F9F4DBD
MVDQAQRQLFDEIERIYEKADGPLSNEQLYEALCESKVVSESDLVGNRLDIGGDSHSLLKRKIRWFQQTLKAAGVIERVATRGMWKMAEKTKKNLTEIKSGFIILGFSTLLGFAAVADAKTMLAGLDQKVDLFLSSPPYPLRNQRDYGGVDQKEYVNWLSGFVELAVDKMADSGSLVLNLSNDIFMHNSPARSTYLERLIIALEDRFNLALMDRIIWDSPNKPRGPVHWVSNNRVHVNHGYEPVLWFAKNPALVKSNNQNVLQPHTEIHKKFILSGGNKKERVNGDRTQKVKVGAFSNMTEGTIPRNVLRISTTCKSQREYKRYCSEQGLAQHGATMPLKLADFFVKFLTDEHDLCMDMFGGSSTLGLASELNNRRWITTDKTFDYVAGASYRFKDFEGFEYNKAIDKFLV